MPEPNLRRVALELRSSARFPSRRIWSDDLLKLADGLDGLLDRIEALEAVVREYLATDDGPDGTGCGWCGENRSNLGHVPNCLVLKARAALDPNAPV